MSRFAPIFKGKNIDELNMKDYSIDAVAESVIREFTIVKLLSNLRFMRLDGKNRCYYTVIWQILNVGCLSWQSKI